MREIVCGDKERERERERERESARARWKERERERESRYADHEMSGVELICREHEALCSFLGFHSGGT